MIFFWELEAQCHLDSRNVSTILHKLLEHTTESAF